MHDINMYEAQLTVKVRKYEVDIESLKLVLCTAKKRGGGGTTPQLQNILMFQ